MEPVGITYACTSEVVPNSNRMTVTVHSATKPRWASCRGGSCAGGFSCSARVICSGSTSLHFIGKPVMLVEIELNGYRPSARYCHRASEGRGVGIRLHDIGSSRTDSVENRR